MIDTLGMGGAENWLIAVLRHWSTNGVGRMDFLLTSGRVGIFDEEARRLGANLYYLTFLRKGVPAFASGFRKVLRNGRYDAIHSHADCASGWHFLLGTGVLPPIRVAHVHNSWFHVKAHYAVTPSRRMAVIGGKMLTNRLATHVCGTSAKSLSEYGFSRGRLIPPVVRVVYCGFDVGKFNAPREPDRESVLQEFGWPGHAKLALFAGRLDSALNRSNHTNQKNSWLALNAVRVAMGSNSDLRFLMAGAGDARPQLEAHVATWGLQERIRLTGVRMDIPRLMRAADVLFFPSRNEGLGMVAVEAQAAGTPVLASTSVPRECVVVPELYDAVSLDEPIEHWASALLARIEKPRPPVELSRARLEASPFSIENSSRALEQIYRGPPEGTELTCER